MTVLNCPTGVDVSNSFDVLNSNIEILKGNWQELLEYWDCEIEFTNNRPDLKNSLIEKSIECDQELDFIEELAKNSDKTIELYVQLRDRFLRLWEQFSQMKAAQYFEDLELEPLKEFEKA